MAAIELIEKGADSDLLRDLLAFAPDRMMELEVEARTCAPAGVRSPDRLTAIASGLGDKGRMHRPGYPDPTLRKTDPASKTELTAKFRDGLTNTYVASCA